MKILYKYNCFIKRIILEVIGLILLLIVLIIIYLKQVVQYNLYFQAKKLQADYSCILKEMGYKVYILPFAPFAVPFMKIYN